MTNIQSTVTNFIEQDVSIRRGLTRGFINMRALAKYMQENLGLDCTVDAVISAIRRYDQGIKSKEDIRLRYRMIASAKVSSRTRMASVLFRKDQEIRRLLPKLYSRIDFSRGDVLRILEVTQHIKIILDEVNLKTVNEVFSEKDIMTTERNLGEISLIYSQGVVDTPGVFAALASELALNDITIIDGVICGSEHIFIVDEDDLMRGLGALYRISKWGEKDSRK